MALDNNYARHTLTEDPRDSTVEWFGDSHRMAKQPQWWTLNIYVRVEERGTNKQTDHILKMEPNFRTMLDAISKDVYAYVHEQAPGKFISGHLICRIRKNPGKVRAGKPRKRR